MGRARSGCVTAALLLFPLSSGFTPLFLVVLASPWVSSGRGLPNRRGHRKPCSAWQDLRSRDQASRGCSMARGAAQRLSSLLLAAALLAALTAAARAVSVHTLIATECTQYFTWQTIGIAFSHRKIAQPGPLTRLMSCTRETFEKLPDADKAYLDEIPTHWAPSYSLHPRTGDWYPGINKPVAAADWLAHTDIKEDYILVIDADMIMRRPVIPEEMGAALGTAVSGFMGYMIGVMNELALRHVPEVEPRMDERAGPMGRRGDQVGGFTLMHREDLKKVAPLWIKYSEDVRADLNAWNLTGDVYAEPNQPVWIAEMYGYSFACSKAGVWHEADTTFQLYPGYGVDVEHLKSPPKVLHYGILWNITGDDPDPPLYQFDKHWFEEFDALACPPWDLGITGMFKHPPRPSVFNTTSYELLQDLMAVEPVITLNEAFCERHRRKCPPSEQLERECKRADALARELEEAFAQLAIWPSKWGLPDADEVERLLAGAGSQQEAAAKHSHEDEVHAAEAHAAAAAGQDNGGAAGQEEVVEAGGEGGGGAQRAAAAAEEAEVQANGTQAAEAEAAGAEDEPGRAAAGGAGKELHSEL